MDMPLSKEAASFAAEHHDLVYAFLRRSHYLPDEMYDIVIFGYLRAVRYYLTREDLRENYQFSTLAFRCMQAEANKHFIAQNRLKRNANLCPLDEARTVSDCTDSVWERVSRNIAIQTMRERLLEVLTPRQHKVAYLKVKGYKHREIGVKCGLHPVYVGRVFKDAGNAVRKKAPELLELVAA